MKKLDIMSMVLGLQERHQGGIYLSDMVIGLGGAMSMMGLRRDIRYLHLHVVEAFYDECVYHGRGQLVPEEGQGPTLQYNNHLFLLRGLPQTQHVFTMHGYLVTTPEHLIQQFTQLKDCRGRQAVKRSQDRYSIEDLERFISLRA